MRLPCAMRFQTARHRRSLFPTQVAGAWLFISLLLGADSSWGQNSGSQPSHKPSTELLAFDEELQTLAAHVEPSVVKIEVAGLAEVSDPNAPRSSLIARQQGVGSGIIVDPNGFILTNAHVVEHAVTISVALNSGKRDSEGLLIESRRLTAKVVGRDALTDVALLKVEATDLPALVLAKSDSVHVGQVALAFGSPLGLENCYLRSDQRDTTTTRPQQPCELSPD